MEKFSFVYGNVKVTIEPVDDLAEMKKEAEMFKKKWIAEQDQAAKKSSLPGGMYGGSVAQQSNQDQLVQGGGGSSMGWGAKAQPQFFAASAGNTMATGVDTDYIQPYNSSPAY